MNPKLIKIVKGLSQHLAAHLAVHGFFKVVGGLFNKKKQDDQIEYSNNINKTEHLISENSLVKPVNDVPRPQR